MTRIYTVTVIDYADEVAAVTPFSFAYKTMKSARAAVTESFNELLETLEEAGIEELPTLQFVSRYPGDTGCVGRYLADGDRTDWEIEVVELLD